MRRHRTNPQELAILEAAFNKNRLPDWRAKEYLANKLETTSRVEQVWFQNRRQNSRRRRNELSGGIFSRFR
ncbi:hypothetical protein BC938DRAFT_480065 [Jimgerdemannia flammicorona]|uniref:Homeobox domain-containing protein n=1 Tax=Jimgerdemannia flammicorona TaxID=994334 RepID=A0A433QXP5_9FUNG|nr:hypothetical protein BC938DRAFT_480065 [Jimgerdemannia flammicorona]